MAEITSGKTIAKNTIMLYFRMIAVMVVSLYTSRVNLAALGIVDNGIYNVVGGVVGMFAFLNGSLAGATSRFLTYELGTGNSDKLKKTFSAALNVHIGVAIIVFILAETVGIWFMETKMVIPSDRMNVARVVYQLSIIASLISITQVPYSASIISHEKMGVFAYMTIVEVCLKLLISLSLFITPFDKLLTFALLILVTSIGMQMIYRFYCKKKFEECIFSTSTEKSILKPILGFSLWDLFGNFSVMARSQGVNMVMNMFFGPVINSAVGFSTTIGNTVLGFANNFTTAIRPPIVKAYSIKDIDKMESLMIYASKISFVLLMVLSAPFIFESKYILDLWLKTPPPYTDVFCKLELTLSILSSMFLPLVFAIHASGKIRFMSVVNGTIWFLVVPITWILLEYGFNPVVPYVTKICLFVFVAVSNIYSTKHNIPEFDVPLFIKKAIIPSFTTIVISMTLIYLIFINLGESSFIRLIEVCIISTTIISGLSFYMVFDKEMRNKILSIVKSKGCNIIKMNS